MSVNVLRSCPKHWVLIHEIRDCIIIEIISIFAYFVTFKTSGFSSCDAFKSTHVKNESIQRTTLNRLGSLI